MADSFQETKVDQSNLATSSDTTTSVPSSSSEGCTLFVSNLTRNVKNGHLAEIFGVYGSVKKAEVEKHTRSQVSKGTAVLEYSIAEEAESALQHLDGGQIDGQVIKVAYVLVSQRRRRTSPDREEPNASTRERDRNRPRDKDRDRDQAFRESPGSAVRDREKTRDIEPTERRNYEERNESRRLPPSRTDTERRHRDGDHSGPARGVPAGNERYMSDRERERQGDSRYGPPSGPHRRTDPPRDRVPYRGGGRPRSRSPPTSNRRRAYSPPIRRGRSRSPPGRGRDRDNRSPVGRGNRSPVGRSNRSPVGRDGNAGYANNRRPLRYRSRSRTRSRSRDQRSSGRRRNSRASSRSSRSSSRSYSRSSSRSSSSSSRSSSSSSSRSSYSSHRSSRSGSSSPSRSRSRTRRR